MFITLGSNVSIESGGEGGGAANNRERGLNAKGSNQRKHQIPPAAVAVAKGSMPAGVGGAGAGDVEVNGGLGGMYGGGGGGGAKGVRERRESWIIL